MVTADAEEGAAAVYILGNEMQTLLIYHMVAGLM